MFSRLQFFCLCSLAMTYPFYPEAPLLAFFLNPGSHGESINHSLPTSWNSLPPPIPPVSCYTHPERYSPGKVLTWKCGYCPHSLTGASFFKANVNNPQSQVSLYAVIHLKLTLKYLYFYLPLFKKLFYSKIRYSCKMCIPHKYAAWCPGHHFPGQ